MQKKSLLFLFSFMLIGLASAQFYGTPSIGNFLDSVDDSTIVLGAIFLIIFIAANYALLKFFKGNKAAAGAIAFCVALLAIWGANKSGFGYTDLFYGAFFFLPTGFLESIWPFLILAVFIFSIIKYGIKGPGYFMIGAGVLLILLSMIGVFYELGATMSISAILIGAGLAWIFFGKITGFIGKKKKRNNDEAYSSSSMD